MVGYYVFIFEYPFACPSIRAWFPLPNLKGSDIDLIQILHMYIKGEWFVILLMDNFVNF